MRSDRKEDSRVTWLGTLILRTKMAACQGDRSRVESWVWSGLGWSEALAAANWCIKIKLLGIWHGMGRDGDRARGVSLDVLCGGELAATGEPLAVVVGAGLVRA